MKFISKEISVGKDPMSLCAALLYVLCKKNRQDVTQADIAKAAGTTEVTIRKRFKDLEAILIKSSCISLNESVGGLVGV